MSRVQQNGRNNYRTLPRLLAGLALALALGTSPTTAEESQFAVPGDNVVRQTVEYVGVNVDPGQIVSQRLHSEFACGPATLLNCLKFGPAEYRSVYARLPGATDKEKLDGIIERYASIPSVCRKAPATLYTENYGMFGDDTRVFFNTLLADYNLPKIEGADMERHANEQGGDYLRRIHAMLVRSLSAGVPVSTSMRLFSVKGTSTDWRVVGGHAVLITRVPAKLESWQRGFEFQYVDPYTGAIAEGYMRIESEHHFWAIKGSGEQVDVDGSTGYRWMYDSFLVVEAPLFTSNAMGPGEVRSLVAFSWGMGKF